MAKRSSLLGVSMFVCGVVLAASTPTSAGTITKVDRATVVALLGGNAVTEDFGGPFRFPISTGVLNSNTNLIVSSGPPIVPGLIKPGATYSTPIRSGPFFNLDNSIYFSGAFLADSTPNAPRAPLTITFDSPQFAIAFDNGAHFSGPDVNVTIHFTNGTSFSDTFPLPTQVFQGENNYTGLGFTSTAVDITSVDIVSLYGQTSFLVDNVLYSSRPSPIAAPTQPNEVPEPTGVALLAVGLVGLWTLRRHTPQLG